MSVFPGDLLVARHIKQQTSQCLKGTAASNKFKLVLICKYEFAATKLVQSSACSIDANMYVNREVLSLKLVPATMFSEFRP